MSAARGLGGSARKGGASRFALTATVRTCRLVIAAATLACTSGGERRARDARVDSVAAATRPGVPTLVCGAASGNRSSGDSVRRIEVNRGTHGLMARVRWALSGDRCAMIVVEDPVSIEADPIANGFVLASETIGRAVQVDDVWDASPSPDWTRAAFGQAYRRRAGGDDSLTAAQWAAWAREIGMPERDVRGGAFSVSGMAIIHGFARPGIISLRDSAVRLFPVAAGWRVAWSADGSRLAAGVNRAPPSDDAPATRWVALDTASGMPRGEISSSATFAAVRWTEGPTIDVTTRADSARTVTLAIDGGVVESEHGRVTRNGRVVGPGVALAATRTGRYIAALAPSAGAGEHDPKETLVVYVTP
jgi:hypothetical protein